MNSHLQKYKKYKDKYKNLKRITKERFDYFLGYDIKSIYFSLNG